MIQRVLSESDWTQRMLPDDLRALTPLLYAHGTPYGAFWLDMSKRLAIDQDAVAASLTAPLRSTLAHILVCFLALRRQPAQRAPAPRRHPQCLSSREKDVVRRHLSRDRQSLFLWMQRLGLG